MRTTSWTQEQVNIGLAQRAWSHYYIPWSLRGNLRDYFQQLFELCAEDVVWKHEGPRHPRLPMWAPGEIRGKQALIHAFTVDDADLIDENELEDPVDKPLQFIASGDRVVVLLEERYRIKKTGVTVRNNHVALIMTFHDGRISQLRAVANLSDWVEAFLGAGWTTRAA